MDREVRDDYAWWRAAIATGRIGPVHDGHPQCGFYKRRKFRNGPWVPVAIWRQNGSITAWEGRADGARVDPSDVWTWVAKTPVPEPDYRVAYETGAWPTDAPPAAGHNRASDPYEALKADIEDAISGAETWLGTTVIADQHTADIAGNRIVSMRELARRAKASHETEKEPHLEAGRAVDKKYLPLIKALTQAAESLKSAVARWADAERTRLEAARRAAEEECLRVETENRGRAVPAPLPVVPDVKVQAGGGSGRKIGFTVRKTVVVRDHVKALRAFKNHPDIVALVARLAEQSYRSTGKVPAGCDEKEETRVS